MKTALITLLIAVSIAVTAQDPIWTSQDSVSVSTCYEYDSRREVLKTYGRRGWKKDDLIWQKEQGDSTIIMMKTIDKKRSVVVIRKKPIK